MLKNSITFDYHNTLGIATVTNRESLFNSRIEERQPSDVNLAKTLTVQLHLVIVSPQENFTDYSQQAEKDLNL